MHYRPGKDDHGLAFDPFKSCTVPRPIGWLSTISSSGIANLAPFSQWQNLTFDPPLVMFAANQTVEGRSKDTVVNAEETGWFVWNMATDDLREAVNASASSLPPEEDEFEFAGVTKGACIDAPGPLVAESPVHLECRYRTTHHIPGNSAVGTVDVVYGEVVRIHIDESIILDNGKLDILKIRPIARLGYYDYTTVDSLFEMQIPNASAAHLAGLEGRPTAPKET